MLRKVFLGYGIGYNTVKPIRSKIAAIHKNPSPTGKVALMSSVGALIFYTKFIEKLHINLKPFYDLSQENTPWNWTSEHELLFNKLKTSLTSDTEFTIPNTRHPFFITVDASLIGPGAVLFQINEDNKLKVISHNSRILPPQEQILSTLDRELSGFVHALQIYGSHYSISTSNTFLYRSQTSFTFTLFYKKTILVHAFIELKCS